MDSQQAQEFRRRWEAAAAIEVAEQRMASLELRWRQLNAIWELARELGLPLTSNGQEEEVWQRWAKLKANLA